MPITFRCVQAEQRQSALPLQLLLRLGGADADDVDAVRSAGAGSVAGMLGDGGGNRGSGNVAGPWAPADGRRCDGDGVLERAMASDCCWC